MTGKEKCIQLRQIRRKIARDNEIPFPEEDCYYEGADCEGTCDMCDTELNYLEMKLEERTKAGLPVFLDLHEAEALRFRSRLSGEDKKPRRSRRDTGTRGMMRRA